MRFQNGGLVSTTNILRCDLLKTPALGAAFGVSGLRFARPAEFAAELAYMDARDALGRTQAHAIALKDAPGVKVA
jgi:hypothetical protein